MTSPVTDLTIDIEILSDFYVSVIIGPNRLEESSEFCE